MTQRHGSLNGVIGLAAGLVAGVSIYCVAQVGSGDLTDPPSADDTEKQIHASQAFEEKGVERVLRQAQESGSGGRGWTERSEGSPGVSGYRPPTPATPKLEIGATPSASTVNQNATIDATTLHSVTIQKPAGPPQVLTGLTDPHGNAVTVSCSTCHATRQPNNETRTVADLNEFHGSLKIAHGKISCLSCHNSNDYDSLKLADGSRVEFTEVMSLCGQCHGPQMRDYDHNVHGGMNGHWDLAKGPRQKNNCVDCHNPHSPQFPKMQPTFKPRDRFLDPHRND